MFDAWLEERLTGRVHLLRLLIEQVEHDGDVVRREVPGGVDVAAPLLLPVERAERDDPAVAGGGALFEGGVHWIDLLANSGLEVESARGFRPDPGAGLERQFPACAVGMHRQRVKLQLLAAFGGHRGEMAAAVVGQNAAADVHRELADPSSPLVASVA